VDYILAGIAPELSECTERQDDLPGTAIAAVECQVDSNVVDSVGFYLFADDDDMLDAIEEFITGDPVATESAVDRVLATVLFSDIVDSTVHAAEMGDRRWRAVLEQHDEVVRRDGDVAGIAVHIGARLGALAHANEVLVSNTVRDLTVGSDLAYSDRGVHELKGVPGDWQVWSAST